MAAAQRANFATDNFKERETAAENVYFNKQDCKHLRMLIFHRGSHEEALPEDVEAGCHC
jgi:hypothetical protein